VTRISAIPPAFNVRGRPSICAAGAKRINDHRTRRKASPDFFARATLRLLPPKSLTICRAKGEQIPACARARDAVPHTVKKRTSFRSND
jgi:hypothetical protein